MEEEQEEAMDEEEMMYYRKGKWDDGDFVTPENYKFKLQGYINDKRKTREMTDLEAFDLYRSGEYDFLFDWALSDDELEYKSQEMWGYTVLKTNDARKHIIVSACDYSDKGTEFGEDYWEIRGMEFIFTITNDHIKQLKIYKKIMEVKRNRNKIRLIRTDDINCGTKKTWIFVDGIWLHV